MAVEESISHHYVPKLLLRPWLKEEPLGQHNLSGYYWDDKGEKFRCKRSGLKSFCYEDNLLTLHAHPHGKDAIERQFFGVIDGKGAVARDLILKYGPGKLTEEQRCDFARLLLSLEMRRPQNVAKARNEGPSYFISEIDNDPELQKLMAEEGIPGTPSSYAERERGVSFPDQALMSIQDVVDNAVVGKPLINASWHIVRLGPSDGTLVLADRPLIRHSGYNDPNAIWALPLTPKAAFLLVKHISNQARIRKISPQRLAKWINANSVWQAEKYVFSTDKTNESWIEKYLAKKARRVGGLSS